jgi:uncharacterized protein (DUF2062 family)
VVFKRRHKRPIWQVATEALWPKGGWARAAQYVQHRLRRLPGSPEHIARGIAVGVFTTFTPFYGLHFAFAGLLALLFRGNILAAFLSTFFGNPLTYVPIGVVSLQTGYWILGVRSQIENEANLPRKFMRAFLDLWQNVKGLFTGEPAHWGYLSNFFETVFFPYLIGGIGPGIITSVVIYFISVPLLRAYQERRRKSRRERYKRVANAGRKTR